MFESWSILFQQPGVLESVLFIFGILLGSFANVVIYRLPLGKSIIHPRSACLNCHKTIPWFANIPVFSWFLLRGKCWYCHKAYSFRYPFVELLTGVCFAICANRFGLSISLIESLIFSFSLICCTFIDLDHMILPDEFTLSGIVIGLIGALINPDRDFLSALYGVLLGGGFLWSVAYLYYVLRKQDGMGGGDIKLLAWIGAVLGWNAIPVIIIGSSFLGAIIGSLLLLGQKNLLKRAIPFGPYLVFTALAYMYFHGERLGEWYMRMHGLID